MSQTINGVKRRDPTWKRDLSAQLFFPHQIVATVSKTL
jgi:hypothetical protein